MNNTIHPSKIRGMCVEKSGYIFSSLDSMNMGVDNLVGLRFHVVFYTGVLSY